MINYVCVEHTLSFDTTDYTDDEVNDPVEKHRWIYRYNNY